eukprot:scaffold29539_cov20-Prasinocladus_malaysianus.AAC.2
MGGRSDDLRQSLRGQHRTVVASSTSYAYQLFVGAGTNTTKYNHRMLRLHQQGSTPTIAYTYIIKNCFMKEKRKRQRPRGLIYKQLESEACSVHPLHICKPIYVADAIASIHQGLRALRIQLKLVKMHLLHQDVAFTNGWEDSFYNTYCISANACRSVTCVQHHDCAYYGSTPIVSSVKVKP